MRSLLVFSFIFLIVTANNVQADQITDIGVTRAEMVREYQKLWLAFVFAEEDRLTDGRPRIRGECDQCPKGFLTIELIGPKQGYIQTASVQFAFTNRTDDACLLKGKLALLSLLEKIFPKWGDDIYTHYDFYSAVISSDQSKTMHRNGLRVSLSVQRPMDGRIYTLIVDSD